MAYETIIYQRKGRIAYITLNRPEVLNAISDTVHEELVDATKAFDADDELWVAIISGKGRCFSAGADVKQRQLRPREELVRLGGPAGVKVPGGGLGLGQTVNWKPVIAAIHGYCIGAALGIAMDCDLIVAADKPQFQIREVERGIAGARLWASAWYWGGGRMATEMALTGRFLSAEEAYRLGMVNRIVPPDQIMAEAEKLAEEILVNPPLSVRCNVRVSRWNVLKLRDEAEMYRQALKLHLTEDFQESARAFLEKRAAVFKGK